MKQSDIMKTQRMKLDYNHLFELIDNFLEKVSSEDTERDVFAIVMGLNLLSAYMKDIAERTLEINDEVLIGLLKDLCLLIEKEGDTE